MAGAYNSNVGSYTPYFVHLTRRDTEQEITSYSLVLPKGITGKLAGIPFCPEAAIAAARSKQGRAETADPSCPAASQVGRTLTGYGVGSALTYAPGAHLPRRSLPRRPALAGHDQLGHGRPLRPRHDRDPLGLPGRPADRAAADRLALPRTRSPTSSTASPCTCATSASTSTAPNSPTTRSSCEPSQLISTLTGSGATFANAADDSTATATQHFQLLNCLTLGFRPKLGIRLRGGSRRDDYPQLRATFAARGPGDSNLKRIEVTMPHSEFLAQEHIKTICTRPQFEAENCPAGSVYGHAVAYTPLFDEPLRGDVFLRSSTHRAARPGRLASQRRDPDRHRGQDRHRQAGGIRVLFDNLPDAPINRFTMTLNGGKRGLLVNSANICRTPPSATVRALGQNNIGASFTTMLRGQCGAKGKPKPGGGKRGGR